MDESILASGRYVLSTSTLFLVSDFSPRKALKALLTNNNAQDAELTNESLQLAFVTARELGTSNTRFFEVVADLICQSPDHKFAFEETICLGLANLCHTLRPVRGRALRLLRGSAPTMFRPACFPLSHFRSSRWEFHHQAPTSVPTAS